MEKKVFWNDEMKEGDTGGGGYYFRSFELNKFIEKVEKETGQPVVGLVFEDNNVELVIKVE